MLGLALFFLGGSRQSVDSFRHFARPFLVAFHRSIAVLMRYRFPGIFRLGSWLLPAWLATAMAGYFGGPLVGRSVLTELSSSVAGYSKHASAETGRSNVRVLTLHLPCGIQFGLFPFRSPLLGESLLFSVPLLIRMLFLGRFPCLATHMSVKGISDTDSEIPGS